MGSASTKEEIVVAQNSSVSMERNWGIILGSMSLVLIVMCICVGLCFVTARFLKKKIIKELKKEATSEIRI